MSAERSGKSYDSTVHLFHSRALLRDPQFPESRAGIGFGCPPGVE